MCVIWNAETGHFVKYNVTERNAKGPTLFSGGRRSVTSKTTYGEYGSPTRHSIGDLEESSKIGEVAQWPISESGEWTHGNRTRNEMRALPLPS